MITNEVKLLVYDHLHPFFSDFPVYVLYPFFLLACPSFIDFLKALYINSINITVSVRDFSSVCLIWGLVSGIF